MTVLWATLIVLAPFGAAAGLIWFMASGKKQEPEEEQQEDPLLMESGEIPLVQPIEEASLSA